ncbi:MAG: uroporphyrinogen decarboxylase family protein [Puniceicoccaceae bacterium]
MTSRERILAALNHRPVDRVPVDLGGTRQSGIAALAYAALREEIGLDTSVPFKVFDLYQQLAELEPGVLERFGSDTLPLNRPKVAFGIENRDWKPFRFFDGPEVLVPGGFQPETTEKGSLVLKKGDGIIAEMPKNGFYFDRYEKYPGASQPDLDSWEPPRIGEADLEHYAAESRRLFEETDKAIIAAMGPPYELFNGIGQGGFEDWMVTFATEDEYVEELYERLTDAWIDNLKHFHEAVGDRVQVIQIADDLGTQESQFLSTAMFREKVMPFYRRGIDWIHANTSWKVLLHSDGAIFDLIPSLIEMGVDALNPIQTSARGMDPDKLEAAYGGKITFWGGSCDSQNTLGTGSPAEVREQTLAHLESFRPLEGGFVFASVHNIQANVPPENIIALFDTAREFAGGRPE